MVEIRYVLLEDNTPFCTMLFVDWEYHGKGYGKKLMEHWENDMKSQGYGIEAALDMADKAAEEDDRRYTHEEVFSKLRRRVNG